jgi:hypothetical protein
MYTHNRKLYWNALIGFEDNTYEMRDLTFVQSLHFARRYHVVRYAERRRHGAPALVTTYVKMHQPLSQLNKTQHY